MNNVVLSTRNIDDLVTDIANEVLKKIEQTRTGTTQSVQNDEFDLLTVPQIAEYLSLTKDYVYKLISKGELPIMKRGKRVFASKADLFAYMKEGRKLTNSELERKADQHIANKKRSRV